MKSAGKHEFVDLDGRRWQTSDKTTISKRAKECLHLLRIFCEERVHTLLGDDFSFNVKYIEQNLSRIHYSHKHGQSIDTCWDNIDLYGRSRQCRIFNVGYETNLDNFLSFN